MSKSRAAHECEMALAILISSFSYKNNEHPDPSIIESLMFAADACLERARESITEELKSF